MATHHEGHRGSESAAAASWLMAMVLFAVLAFALVVALIVWAPWDDAGTVSTPGTNDAVPGEQDNGGDVNINGEADIDVGSGDEGGDTGGESGQ
ncbi:MAG: hypothetical protein WD904_00930 [Dehalococcoidia bacterium]